MEVSILLSFTPIFIVPALFTPLEPDEIIVPPDIVNVPPDKSCTVALSVPTDVK